MAHAHAAQAISWSWLVWFLRTPQAVPCRTTRLVRSSRPTYFGRRTDGGRKFHGASPNSTHVLLGYRSFFSSIHRQTAKSNRNDAPELRIARSIRRGHRLPRSGRLVVGRRRRSVGRWEAASGGSATNKCKVAADNHCCATVTSTGSGTSSRRMTRTANNDIEYDAIVITKRSDEVKAFVGEDDYDDDDDEDNDEGVNTTNSLTRPCYPIVKLRSSSTSYTKPPRTILTVPVQLPVLNGYSIHPSTPARQ